MKNLEVKTNNGRILEAITPFDLRNYWEGVGMYSYRFSYPDPLSRLGTISASTGINANSLQDLKDGLSKAFQNGGTCISLDYVSHEDDVCRFELNRIYTLTCYEKYHRHIPVLCVSISDKTVTFVDSKGKRYRKTLAIDEENKYQYALGTLDGQREIVATSFERSPELWFDDETITILKRMKKQQPITA